MEIFIKLSIRLLLLFSFTTTYAAPKVLDIQQWQTENGVKVMYVYLPDIPMVDIRILFTAGSSRDDEHYGIAQLTNAMLKEGTKKHSASEIAESFERVGAHFSTITDLDQASLNLRSLTDTRYLQPALAMLAEVIAEPEFPEDNFQRVKNETLTAIQENQQNPAQVANETFLRLVYGEHPYGHPILGNPTTIKELTVDQMKHFYKKFYVGSNALIAIVGNVKRDQAEKIANQLLTELPKGKKTLPLPPATYHAGPRTKQIYFPSSQTFIRIGSLGTKYNDPLNYALDVGNYTLGGKPLISHLFNEVREKRGLSYNIQSNFLSHQETGTFAISTSTRNDSAKKAIDLSTEILKDFIEKGPTLDEVKKAKQGIIDSFPSSISNNVKVLNAIVTIGFYDLPIDFLDTYQEKISTVSIADIKAAFKKVLKPEQLITVSVGGSSKARAHDPIQLTESKMTPIIW